jgi:hypothetical protein
MLGISTTLTSAPLGISSRAGWYSFLLRQTTQPTCDAATLDSVTAWTAGGFPIANLGPHVGEALIAAWTFYVESNQTFLGIMGPDISTGLSSISDIATNLDFALGKASTGPSHFSVHVIERGEGLVIAVWAPVRDTCYGVLILEEPDTVVELGISSAVGTYYFDITGAGQSACNAATITSVSQWSRNGMTGL